MSDVNFAGLETLIKLLKGTNRQVKVGILQDTVHEGSTKTNASIGAAHEFGTEELPQRSFLRMPIARRIDKELPKFIGKKDFLTALKTKDLTPVLVKAGIAAEACVADAFDTGGFGEWPASNMQYKKNHQTLVETQQLRNSITSEVV